MACLETRKKNTGKLNVSKLNVRKLNVSKYLNVGKLNVRKQHCHRTKVGPTLYTELTWADYLHRKLVIIITDEGDVSKESPIEPYVTCMSEVILGFAY